MLQGRFARCSRVSRFFFHVYDDAVAMDSDGLERSSFEDAMEEAVRGARSLACEQVSHGHLNLSHRIVIANAVGETLATVTFEEAIRIER